MASLERDSASDNYHVRFRYGGRAFRRSLRTGDAKLARARAGRIAETLRLEGGNITSNGVLEIDGGRLRGAGAIDAHRQNSGVIEPGDGVGQLLIDGNLMLSAASMVRFQIGGLTAGTQYDRLIVTGVATLNGVAQVAMVDDFTPEFGDAFVSMTSTVRNGQFAAIQGLGTGGGKILVPSYVDGNLVLTTAPSVGSPAELIRDQFNEGLALLRETMEDWVGLFDIDDFELPVVPDELAVNFALPALVEEFVTSWLPSNSEVVDILNDLRNALTALAFQVIGIEGEPACAPDVKIRAQFTQNVPLETAIGPFNDQTPGLSTDLASSPQLDGDLTLDSDLNFALTFGVDSNGLSDLLERSIGARPRFFAPVTFITDHRGLERDRGPPPLDLQLPGVGGEVTRRFRFAACASDSVA